MFGDIILRDWRTDDRREDFWGSVRGNVVGESMMRHVYGAAWSCANNRTGHRNVVAGLRRFVSCADEGRTHRSADEIGAFSLASV